MSNTSYSTVNSLDEFTYIGGTDFTISIAVKDDSGIPINLLGSTLLLKIAPYGYPSSVITTLTGTVSGDSYEIANFVVPASTSEQMTGGKYMYQPIIEDILGNLYRPKQGTFLLVQSIGNFTDLVDIPSSAFYIYATGTNNYSAESETITQYYEGLTIILYAQNTNTTTSSLTLDNVVGTKSLRKFNGSGTIVELVAGDLVVNKKYLFIYDGTQWVHVGVNPSDGLVTNGNSHDHNGGDGAQINHTTLSNIGTNTHAQIDTFIGTTVPTTYAPLASPAFTGNPTAPTPSVGDNDTSIATTAFVNSEISRQSTDGWTTVSDIWTRTGDHTFTVPTNLTTVYAKGVKVRYKDSGAYEYGVIGNSSYSAPNTTVTLISNSDYAMAAATITETAISRINLPAGFPDWFNWTPTLTGFSADPTNSVYRWRIDGRSIQMAIRQGGNGTSNATNFTITPPIVAATVTNMSWYGVGVGVDNSVVQTVSGSLSIASAGTTINVSANAGPGASTWTNTGGKRLISGNLSYEF